MLSDKHTRWKIYKLSKGYSGKEPDIYTNKSLYTEFIDTS